MDKDTKVKVVSTYNGTVSVSLPNLNWTRVWPKQGSISMVPFSILEEAIFDPGFNNMLQDGILYIEDMEVKKELGLEPPDAKEPENIIVLTENKMIFLLKTASLEVLKETLGKISLEQATNLAHYAIEHQLNDFDKAEAIQKCTGIDITKSILMERADRADDKE